MEYEADNSWQPVFHVHSSLLPSFSGSDIHETGRVIGVTNTFQPNVDVLILPTRLKKLLYMPWSDRSDSLADFLSTCGDIFRLYVSIYANVISKYTIYVNESELERQMNLNGTIKGELFALNVFKRYAFDAHIPHCSDIGHMPLEEAQLNLEDWNSNSPLTVEQIQSVKWMTSIENAVKKGKNILMYERCLPIGIHWAYDIVQEHFFKKQKNGWIKARYKGAVLVNQVGSGKTACALAVSCNSKSQDKDDSIEDLTKLDKSMCFCSSTLIIVPQNLSQQWVEEIQKFTFKKVLSLTCLKDAKGVTIETLDEYDFVITTTNFLKSKGYTDSLDSLTKKVLQTSDKKMVRTTAAQKICARVLAKEMSHFPLIELIHWKRLIIDEVHEIFFSSAQEKERLKIIKSIQATYHWGLTGTPDVSKSESIQSYYLFLSPKVCEDAEQHHHHPCLQTSVEHILLRNFSKTERRANHILHRIQPTAHEYHLLNSFKNNMPIEELVCLATYFVGNNNTEMIGLKTIDQICEIVQNKRMESISLLKAKLEQAENGTPVQEKISKELSDLEKNYSFFQKNIEDLMNFTTCSICMTNKTDSITKCGHCYCFSCISTIVDSKICSFCRTQINLETTFQVSSNECIKVYGSKLHEASIVLKTLLEKQSTVLIFCQWKQIAIAFQELMHSIGIKIQILNGQSSRRLSILKSFRENDTGDALVLILEHFASGLNLPEATHIMFLHAVCGRMADAIGLEEQAIARALRLGQKNEVEVHHFIIKNSIEETLWKKHHTENYFTS